MVFPGERGAEQNMRSEEKRGALCFAVRALVRQIPRMTRLMKKIHPAFSVLLVFLAMIGPVGAEGETPALNEGNTAWMLTATVLVLFMTLPGLALFYGGLVRGRNWLRPLGLVYAGSALTNMTYYFMQTFLGDHPPLNTFYYLCFNLPWMIMPLVLLWRVRQHKPFGEAGD